jgi:aldehyde dehydrogenase (NAD+)
MKEFGLFINGEWEAAKGGATMESINPATEEVWANVAKADESDVERAVAAAKASWDSGVWRDKSKEERAEILRNIATVIMDRQEELIAAEVQDGGGTMRKAAFADIPGAAATFEQFAKSLLEQEEEVEFEEAAPVPSRNIVRREPIGVCAGITPWNFPAIMASWKMAPALAAGNSSVMKPASNTPTTTLMMAECCKQAGVPDGVMNAVSGPGGAVGEALASHPDVRKVAFTGSTEIGRRIMQLASGTMKNITLELGGKSPNIILEDADMDTAALGALYGTFFHSGQVCESGTRILVQESKYDELLEKMVEGAKRITVGDTMDMVTTLGPLVSKAQLDTVSNYVDIGKDEGAEVIMGGDRPDIEKGYYYNPTIFGNVDNSMRIAQEEIFGPVVSVIRFKDEEEAIRIANDSMYGLGGAVWSQNEERALSIARRIETGTVWINDYHMINVRFPFGGYKQSGIGRELGPWGLGAYQEIKHIHVGQNVPADQKIYFGALFN